MAPPQLRLFGSLQAYRSDTDAEVAFPGRTGELLAYLALFRDRRHARARLAGTLWGEHSERNARRCLSTTLWRLRTALDEVVPGGDGVLRSNRSEVSFRSGAIFDLDVAEFERATLPLVSGSPPATLAAALKVERALRLYRGELLDGMFHEWVLRERSRLAGLRRWARIALMRFHRERDEAARSIDWGLELLRDEPYQESVLREVMRLQARAGQRGLALELYQRTAHVLFEEFGAEPTEETRALYHRIRGEGGSALDLEPAPGSEYGQLARTLRTAARDLEAARSRVRRAVQAIEKGDPPRPSPPEPTP